MGRQVYSVKKKKSFGAAFGCCLSLRIEDEFLGLANRPETESTAIVHTRTDVHVHSIDHLGIIKRTMHVWVRRVDSGTSIL
jgi:hypothetical protein